MEKSQAVDFTEILPTEVLFQICFNLTRAELAKCAFVCKNIKPACMYVLEHKRKIRLVGDILNVVFVSLPEAGKTMLIGALTKSRIHRPPSVGADRIDYVKLETKSIRGNTQIIALIDAPNGKIYRKRNWILASQSDVCVFVVNAFHPNYESTFDKDLIRELVLGVTHMMSSRDVIVAVNVGNDTVDDSTPETRFRQMEKLITPLLNKTIGPCFDIVPVDALQKINVFATSVFPWFKGPALWTMLVASQQRTNYDEKAVEKLRKAPFEMQIVQKEWITGVGAGVAIGRVLAGSVSVNTDPALIKSELRLIPHSETSVRSMEMGYTTMTTAMPGDFVALNLKDQTKRNLRKRYGFIYSWSGFVDITLAFRIQFVAINPKLLALHNIYHVHYGAHRVHCALLWIFPSNNYKSSVDAKKLKQGQAIMVPLERVPMRVYKANEFQKNVHGKVMLTQKHGAIVAIGRIDKVISQTMNNVTLPTPKDYQELYNVVVDQAKLLFVRSLKEEKLLEEFLKHITTNSKAKHIIVGCTKKFDDKQRWERNE